MLVIEPTNGHELTHWSQMNWTAVEANVRHLQGRIYRAATLASSRGLSRVRRDSHARF